MPNRTFLNAMLAVPVIGLLCSVSGCGNDDNKSKTTVTTVSGDKPVNSLTSGETQQFCNDFQTYLATNLDVNNGKAAVCTYEARDEAQAGSAATACQTSFNSCLANSTFTPANNEDAGVCTLNVGDCSATVAQLSTCLAGYISLVNSIYVSIAQIGSSVCTKPATNLPNFTSVTPPDSCAAIAQICPSAMTSPSGS